MKKYYKRIADRILHDKLEAKGAVLVEGPKGCGKTTTASQIAKSVIFMQNPAKKSQYLKMAELDPSLLLDGETPRLIDEWQLAPQIWDAVRFEVDKRDMFNQFILTGSSSATGKMSTSHSGTGRISRMIMRPMTLFESGDSTGSVSLGDLFKEQKNFTVKSEIDIQRIAYLICRGGWPKALDQSEKIALRQAYDYYDSVIESDISLADGVKRNPQRVKLLMRSYSRFIASDAKITKIKADMVANDLDSLNEDTIFSYINALKQIFVIEDIPAWSPNLRSQTAIRTTDTRHFTDPSIATAALGIGPTDLINDLNTMGLLFESMCIRDLRVFSEALDGTVYHYRDKTGLECDAVIHLRNGSYALIEAKLGGSEIDEAAQKLLSLKGKIDTNRMKAPSFLMVLTGTEFGYLREDGVYVVPVGCLRE
ncbi:MAG: ATP-binding protein [Clostridiales bacterium]|nr:ATP-binding protein [Clostridiales bacterium]